MAAESGLVSAPSSDGASFDSADTQPSTMRRRLTSAGIADAERALRLSRAVQAVSHVDCSSDCLTAAAAAYE